jgi:hypothetical protein
MEEYIIFLIGAFIFGFIIGCVIMYNIMIMIKKWKIQGQFERDCIDNAK